jgi:hypothetical protein
MAKLVSSGDKELRSMIAARRLKSCATRLSEAFAGIHTPTIIQVIVKNI